MKILLSAYRHCVYTDVSRQYITRRTSYYSDIVKDIEAQTLARVDVGGADDWPELGNDTAARARHWKRKAVFSLGGSRGEQNS